MKTKILLLFSCINISFNCFATHDRAGEITFRITGSNSIEATAITYTKLSGASLLADRDTIAINWGDGSQTILDRTNGPINANGFHGGVLIAPDILQSLYTGTHQFSATPPPPLNYYVLSFYDQNRMAGVSNISGGNSVDVPFYIQDTVYFPTGIGLNSSPVFLNPPIYYSNVNDTFNFNSVAYDADGDSMSFVLIDPLQGGNSSVPQYLYPDQFCQANGNTSSTLQINPATGQIMWASPCAQGIFDIAIVVTEYRCGYIIGTVERDMVITVLAENNHPPQLTSVFDTFLQPGQTFQFNVTATDADAGQSDSLIILGGAFSATQNAPVFQSVTGNPASGIFSWTPDSTFASYNAHIFSILAFDNDSLSSPDGPIPAGLIDCKTFRVWVADTVTSPCRTVSAIDKIKNNAILVFPNPATTQLNIISDEIQPSLISIYSFSGQKVMEKKFSPQLNIAQLNAGIYFIEIYGNGNIMRDKFVKL